MRYFQYVESINLCGLHLFTNIAWQPSDSILSYFDALAGRKHIVEQLNHIFDNLIADQTLTPKEKFSLLAHQFYAPNAYGLNFLIVLFLKLETSQGKKIFQFLQTLLSSGITEKEIISLLTPAVILAKNGSSKKYIYSMNFITCHTYCSQAGALEENSFFIIKNAE
jgi:hypothetical protein